LQARRSSRCSKTVASLSRRHASRPFQGA